VDFPLSPSVFLFDVDGVITDEHAQVSEPVLRSITALVANGSAVGFVTGRSRSWLEAKLLPGLAALPGGSMVVEKAPLACEMGAVRRRPGAPDWEVEPRFAVPTALRESLRHLPTAPSYIQLVEWDASKEATATFESIHRPDLVGHAAQARAALADLFAVVEPLAAAAGCHAQLSTYALDVLTPGLDKSVGAAFVLHELAAEVSSAAAFVFGDSASDRLMAVTAVEHGFEAVEFCWVGSTAPPLIERVQTRQSELPHAAGTDILLSALLAES